MKVVIPGLDHSLVEVDGHFLWKAEPGFVQPPQRKNVKTNRNKEEVRLNGWGTPSQTSIWGPVAER